MSRIALTFHVRSRGIKITDRPVEYVLIRNTLIHAMT
jgi:hypothetical protein